MKKTVLVTTFLIAFIVTATLIGCSSNKQNAQNTPPPSNTGTTSTGKTFTLDELKTYTGKNGTPAYVAVSGTVYDVTHTRKWKNGVHEEGITAGQDLTDQMDDSPHGTSVLKEVPIVGTLKK